MPTNILGMSLCGTDCDHCLPDCVLCQESTWARAHGNLWVYFPPGHPLAGSHRLKYQKGQCCWKSDVITGECLAAGTYIKVCLTLSGGHIIGTLYAGPDSPTTGQYNRTWTADFGAHDTIDCSTMIDAHWTLAGHDDGDCPPDDTKPIGPGFGGALGSCFGDGYQPHRAIIDVHWGGTSTIDGVYEVGMDNEFNRPLHQCGFGSGDAHVGGLMQINLTGFWWLMSAEDPGGHLVQWSTDRTLPDPDDGPAYGKLAGTFVWDDGTGAGVSVTIE